MTGSYDFALVGFSILVAILASFAALDLTGRVASSSAAIRLGWLTGGATVMGLGIWSMHFVGMLAFHLPMEVGYDVPRVVLSVVVAISASLLALTVVSRPEMGLGTFTSSGLMMGAAISGMHYIGMSSMHLDANLSYYTPTVVLSIVIAIAASLAALWLAFRLRSDLTARGRLLKSVSAVIMGIAISGMHYTAMSGASFSPHRHTPTSEHYIIATSGLGAAVTAGAMVIILLALIGAVIDRSVKARLAFNKELRELFDNVPIGLYRSTPDGCFIEVNTAMVDLLGYPDRETLLRTPAQSLYVDPEDRRRWATTMRETGTVLDFEVRLRRFDGRPITVRDTTHPYRTAQGTTIRYEGALEDISETKRLEDQLRQASKMEAVGQLAGGVAHDFNNLLMVIRGNTDILAQEVSDNESARDELNEIAKAAERASTLTTQLLAFSRRQMLVPKVVNLNTVIRGMREMIARLINEDIEVVTKLDPELGSVLVDPTQAEQVILNLAVNARDAMPKGGVLTITTSNYELTTEGCGTLSRLSPGPYVSLAVEDSGGGINPDVLPHIFEPFFTTKPQGKGTGLGLSTVYGIVQQSGGWIRAENRSEGGARFNVAFPRSSLAVQGGDDTALDASTLSGRGTILLVEDQPMVRLVTTKILGRLGYTVLEADGVDTALRIAAKEQSHIDLVITDVVMPRLRGPELAKRLRNERPDLRVVFISGYSEDGVAGLGALDSETLFLQKPFTAEALALVVREALGNSERQLM
ncbi:MAG TPA: MHYT domain-containing protein [Gemmatimonadaceae bacterium]